MIFLIGNDIGTMERNADGLLNAYSKLRKN